MTGKQLKNSILQWAIQGKLVPQDPNDEPASVLLARIREEKARLVKEKKIKRDKNETIIFRGEDNSYYEKNLLTQEVACIDDEIPFELPKGWEWVRMSHIAEIARGGSPRPIKDYLTTASDGINWIKIGDTEIGGKYITSCKEKIKPSGISKSRMVYPGDFLLTNSMSFGRPYITQVEGCIHDGWLVIAPIKGLINSDYLYYLLSSGFAFQQFAGKVSGAVVKNLNSDKVADAIFPIPPLNEQKAIVQKIETIAPLIEQYKNLEENTRLLSSTLFSKIRKSVLQEAIQGKLVPQIAAEGTAESLLEEIDEEKKRLVTEGKLKRSAPSSSTIFRGDDNKYYERIGKLVRDISDELPFEIPESWRWTKLSFIAEIYTGNSVSETEKKSLYSNVKGRCYIGTKDISFNHHIAYDNGIAIPQKYEPNFKIATCNSVLMCIEGGSAGRKIAILNQDVCFGNKLCCFAPFAPMGKFIYYYLQSASFLEIFNRNKSGIIGGVSIAKVKDILIPIPSLSEQHRIVSKIEELFQQLK